MDILHKGGTPVSQQFVYGLLQGCTKKKDLAAGRQIYCLMASNGLESLAILGEPLIRLFATCGSLLEANLVFCKVAEPSVYTWHAIISANATNGQGDLGLDLYYKMQQDGIQPSKYVFPCILKACRSIGALKQGMLIHGDIVRSGSELDVVIGSTLVDMYAKCGSLEEARNVFEELPNRDVVSWGAMIAGYARHGQGLPALQLFDRMQQKGIKPTVVTFLCILKACGSIRTIGQGKLMHDQIIRDGYESDLVIGNALIDMYVKCGTLEEACKVFDNLQNPDVVSYGSLISGHVQHGHSLLALQLFEEMQQRGTNPNKIMYVCILKACSSIGALEQGKAIHKHIIRSGLESDVVLGNTLIDMYSKCASMDEARKVFDSLWNRDAVSWGAMSAGYIQCGHGVPVTELFVKMQEECVEPDKVTFLAMLKACSSTGSIMKGRLIHEHIIKCGLEIDAVVGSMLVDIYAKGGSLDEAEKVFHALPCQDVVSWSAMIAGYVQHGDSLYALELFQTMLRDGINPDKITFLSILKACSSIAALGHGKMIHEQIIIVGLESDVVIGSILIDVYAKCGNLKEAYKVFDKLPHQDVVSWGAIIAGHAQHGNYRLATKCFEEMQREGLKPHGMIYTSILSACSHAGHVNEGYGYITSMIEDHGIMPSVEHFNCIVDLLGRAGQLKEAVRVLQTMPVPPDVVGWTALLTACRAYGNMEIGRQCFDQIMHLDPDVSFGYALISNLYADAHNWKHLYEIQELKKCFIAWKKPGKAWIEVDENVHEFTVEDKSHPETNTIYLTLNRITGLILQQGYVPHLDMMVEQISEKDEQDVLCGQSEKQATNFGLLSTPDGSIVPSCKESSNLY